MCSGSRVSAAEVSIKKDCRKKTANCKQLQKLVLELQLELKHTAVKLQPNSDC
jgi:hypothetical protein